MTKMSSEATAFGSMSAPGARRSPPSAAQMSRGRRAVEKQRYDSTHAAHLAPCVKCGQQKATPLRLPQHWPAPPLYAALQSPPGAQHFGSR